MADIRGGTTLGCNDRCGCPVPCPGGITCRCTSTGGSAGAAHKTCPCGEHCSCNPCTCPKTVAAAGVGKAYCKCGDGCTCEKCSS